MKKLSPKRKAKTPSREFPIGRTIVAMRRLTKKEMNDLDWRESALVLVLDNGDVLFPSQDPEGNGAGVLFAINGGQEITLS